MTEENQGTGAIVPYNSVQDNLPIKRKRGRPRKDRSQTPGQVFARPTPETEKKNPPGRIDSVTNKKSDMVGQTVFGVIDGSFEAGYLLTVRIGDTDTILKGIVFLPGSSVPISGSNDVAPHIKMIKRAEVHIPRVDLPPHVHGSSSQSFQMNKRSDELSQRTDAFLQPMASLAVNQLPITPIQASPVQVHVTQGMQNDYKAAPQVVSNALHHPEGFSNSTNPPTDGYSAGPTAQSTPVTPMFPQSEMKDKLACMSATSTPNHVEIVTQAFIPEIKTPNHAEILPQAFIPEIKTLNHTETLPQAFISEIKTPNHAETLPQAFISEIKTPNHAETVTQAFISETKAPSTSEAPPDGDFRNTKEPSVTFNQPDDAALAWQTQIMNRPAAGSVNFFQESHPSTLTCGAIPVAPNSSEAMPTSGIMDQVSKGASHVE